MKTAPKPKFEVKFVKRGRDVALFASSLKRTLNRMVTRGFHITRIELDKGGALLMGVKIEFSPREVLQEILQPKESETIDISAETDAFLESVFKKANGRSKEDTLKKLPEAVVAVCRRYNNERLRPILEDMRKYSEAHLAEHAAKNEPPCESAEMIRAVLEFVEKVIRQNVC